MHTVRLSHLLFCCVAAGQMAPQAWSQEVENANDDSAKLDVIIVRGNRSAESIDVDTIQAIAPQDLNEVLSLSPEIDIGGATPSAQRFYLRGLEGTSLVTRFDGVPASNNNLFQHRGAVPQIDPLLIASVVVKTAPVSASDGPMALGGAIEITSISLDRITSLNDPTFLNTNLSYGSANDSFGAAATYARRMDEKVLFVGFGSYRASDDYSDGNGNEVPLSALDSLSAYGKIQYDPSGRHRFDVSVQFSENNGLLPYGAGDFPPEFFLDRYAQGRAGGGPVEQTLQELSVSARYAGSAESDPRAVLFYSDSNLTNEETNAIFSQIRYGGRVSKRLGTQIGLASADFLIGIDGRLERTKAEFNPETTSRFEGDDASNDSVTVGVFSDTTLELGRFDFRAGLRVDYIDFEFGSRSFGLAS